MPSYDLPHVALQKHACLPVPSLLFLDWPCPFWPQLACKRLLERDDAIGCRGHFINVDAPLLYRPIWTVREYLVTSAKKDALISFWDCDNGQKDLQLSVGAAGVRVLSQILGLIDIAGLVVHTGIPLRFASLRSVYGRRAEDYRDSYEAAHVFACPDHCLL